MSAKSDLTLPLALLKRVHETLSDAPGPDAFRETYPLLVDVLEMAIAEIARQATGGRRAP